MYVAAHVGELADPLALHVRAGSLVRASGRQVTELGINA